MPSLRILVVSFSIFAVSVACNPEGTGPGECTDRADNDGNGVFDCNDPGCAGSPDCASPATINPVYAEKGSSGTGPCSKLQQVPFSGAKPCFDLGFAGTFVTGRLSTIWRNQPRYICVYSFNGATTGCGPAAPNNAFYCGIDDSISWHGEFMNQQFFVLGDFAPAVVAAHEWGHLNQARTGLLGSPLRVQKQNELHADCQAGIFAAIEESVGNLQAQDINEAFRSLCLAGDPAWAWYNPNGHGTCNERVSAFTHGYTSAKQQLDSLCGGNPQTAMLAICAN